MQKLRRMDALVHICYEVSGTAGSFCTALALIPAFGNNMSFIITPFFFAAAGVVWFFIQDFGFSRMRPEVEESHGTSYFASLVQSISLFHQSVITGARILFTRRKFIWLVPGYALALYGHRSVPIIPPTIPHGSARCASALTPADTWRTGRRR